jgi:hypothetical protein
VARLEEVYQGYDDHRGQNEAPDPSQDLPSFYISDRRDYDQWTGRVERHTLE